MPRTPRPQRPDQMYYCYAASPPAPDLVDARALPPMIACGGSAQQWWRPRFLPRRREIRAHAVGKARGKKDEGIESTAEAYTTPTRSTRSDFGGALRRARLSCCARLHGEDGVGSSGPTWQRANANRDNARA
jgi:hypothetical protein